MSCAACAFGYFLFSKRKDIFNFPLGTGRHTLWQSFSYADFCFARHSQTSLPLLSLISKLVEALASFGKLKTSVGS